MNRLEIDLRKEKSADTSFISIDHDLPHQIIVIDSPVLVQVQSIKRADLPRMNNMCYREDSKAFYDIGLTDGTNFFNALYMSEGSKSKLKLSCSPGCKLSLKNEIDVWNQILFLNPTNTQLLGGIVEDMREAWEAKRIRTSKDLFA